MAGCRGIDIWRETARRGAVLYALAVMASQLQGTSARWSRRLALVRATSVSSAVLAAVALLLAVLPGARADAAVPPTTPAAYLLVDDDTGNVLAASNEHAALSPASTTKLLTALTVEEHLAKDARITISQRAADMPAMKVGMHVGEVWTREQLLYSLLMVSANDAAVALGEASGGDLDGFARQRLDVARTLGATDSLVLNDPSGLDDPVASYRGGDAISAHDMAMVARAALANPEIRTIVGTKVYTFTGPDGAVHRLTNHNKMLTTYAGAIGMKTGYTTKARSTFVGAANRDGRTMIAVVLGADNPYDYARLLLDQGFATPVTSEPTDHGLREAVAPAATPAAARTSTQGGGGGSVASSTWFAGAFLVVVVAMVLAQRARVRAGAAPRGGDVVVLGDRPLPLSPLHDEP